MSDGDRDLVAASSDQALTTDAAPDTEPAPPVVDGENSVWAELRRQHARVAGAVSPCYLPVETYTGVVARYKYVPLDDTKAATNRQMGVRDVTDLARIAAIDSLVLAIDGLMYVDRDNGTIPTDPDGKELYPLPLSQLGLAGEPAIRYDERLSEAMGFTSGLRASQIVRQFFANDDRTLMDHASKLAEWTSTARRAVTEDVAGG